MPWTSSDAKRHTKAARTLGLQKQWSRIANSVLAKTGDEASAIRQANAAIKNHPSTTSAAKKGS